MSFYLKEITLKYRLQQNIEIQLSNVESGFRSTEAAEIKGLNLKYIMEKLRKFHKDIYFCFIDCTKDFINIP